MENENLPLFKALDSGSAPWRELPFSRDSWGQEFQSDTIETPFGAVTVKPECLKAYQTEGGLSLLGALKPVLESPSYALLPKGPGGPVEFYRAFRDPGGLIGGYVCAAVQGDSIALTVTDHPASLPSVVDGVSVWTAIDAVPVTDDVVVFKSLYAPGVAITDFVLAMAVLGVDSLAKSQIHIDRYRASHEPTDAQIKAGNYPKRRMGWNGLDLAIENEAGAVRCGTDSNGHAWESRMVYPYGYVLNSMGVDEDPVDVFVGPDEQAPMVYVVHTRVRGEWDKYDEDKAMLGFASEDEARQAFLRHYDDPRYLGDVTAMPVADFVEKVKATKAQPSMIKADTSEPVPAGARWITVHPHGDGSKGVPVLVQETQHGSGVFHVIGGAGGKLNYMKLRGVKSEGEYRKDAQQRQADKKADKKKLVEQDKQLGIHEAKQQARQDLKAQKTKAEQDFIQSVANAMGWSEAELSFKADTELSPDAEKKGRTDHHRDLLRRAVDAVSMQRQKLVADADARAAAGLGEVPFDAQGDDLSVDDLDPVHVNEGSGVDHAFGDRAKANGLTQEKLDHAISAVKEAEIGAIESQVKAAAALAKGEVAQQIREELKAVQKPDLKAKIVDAKQAVALLKAHKQLKAIQKAAREAGKEIDASHVEPKAYVLAVSAPSDEDVAKDIDDDLRTVSAKAFLGEVEKSGGSESLQDHVAGGAHNSINALSQAVAGVSLIDRSVVDVLGVAGAAQVLSRRLHGAIPHQIEQITNGLEQYHADHQAESVKAAMAQAHELQETAKEIELGEAGNAHDLSAAVELSTKRKQALADSRKVLGRVLGEMEASAAMIHALREGARDQVQLSLGKTSLESSIKQLAAIGLGESDYSIDRTAGNVFVTVKASGMDKLAGGIDAENLARVDRNLAIQRGDYDEDDWLPQGFANRPDLALKPKAGVSPTLAAPMDFNHPDTEQAIKDYIGGRMADGDAPADILADVQSGAFFDKAGDKKAYGDALKAVVPTKDAKTGKMIRVEQLAPLFDQYADDYVAAKWGGERSPLNKQTFDADEKAQDALHRALADEPAGAAAYKPVGDLTHQDGRALRDWFAANIAKESPLEKEQREKVEDLAANEPERFTQDMFGETTETPEWSQWKADFDAAKAAHKAAKLDWPTYVKAMCGRTKALEAVQDCIRSSVADSFVKHYNVLNPDKALKVGRTIIRGNLNHLGAVDPAAREAKIKEERALIDSLRERQNGKYASGKVSDKIDAAQEQKAAFEQAQMSFFSSEEAPVAPLGDTKPLAADERHTLGHAAEAKIASMMHIVGKNFEPGKPVKIFQPTMSGASGAKRQRAIKLVRANKRVILGAGVGSGKTAMGLGAFSDLHSSGEVKKGLFVVPSIVQGQFGAEALRFLKPGQFDWHCEPGASYEDRLAAYKDPAKHFAVVTHQSFRDDVLRMAADKEGTTPDAITEKLAGMSKAERAAYTKEVFDHHGVGFDYVMADEAHGLLNRDGKENSSLSNVVEGVTDNAPYYVHASGDPVKNDASEAFSLLQKMDGQRYADKDAFMRRYGGDTKSSKEGLQRELARHLYAMQIKPDVSVSKQVQSVPLTGGQKATLDQIDQHAAAVRIAKMEGKADIEAAKALAPSMFEGVPEDQHEDAAKRVAASVGIVKETAIKRALNAHAESGKLDALAQHAAARKGKQGVVFAHSLAAVEAIKARLEKDGHRVVTLSGKDSSKDKAAKIQAFNPDKGDAQADIIVCSDAGATGANLQSGHWLVQYDTPDTAMTHAQRQGRINRIGQKNAIELTDLVSDHPSERRARNRLSTKYGLRDLMTSPLESLDDTGLAYYLKQTGQGSKAQDSLF